jgi:hypothetical protein
MDEANTWLLTIGDVSEKTGLPVKRIHYYERRGLVEPAGRSDKRPPILLRLLVRLQ